MKRFYKDVSVEERAGAFAIMLDGKQIKTPRGAALAVPTRALAEAIGEEWRAQSDMVDPAAMRLTKLANTAINRTDGKLSAELAGYGNSDVLCYRAEAPPELIARENAAWDPLLKWIAERHGARLKVGSGLGFVQQSPEALAALERAMEAHSPFVLTGLYEGTTILGSIVLALALADGRLDPTQALNLAELNALYQAEKWGMDAQAEERLRRLTGDLEAATRFMHLAWA